MNIPQYWKSTLGDIESIVKTVKKGKVSSVQSAGGRPVYLVEYGEKNELRRTANYSSACGTGDITCYADKRGDNIRPCVFLVGAIHGSEIEGTVALLNLISLIETGRDLGGEENSELSALADNANLLLIPCANPDGRDRVPFVSPLGMSLEEFRHFAQGTWKDGSLCGWPQCKRVHPILEAAGHLGGYYNDDGINIMHDNFTFPMAEETKFLLKIADEYVPDITVLLHGGTNCTNMVLMPQGVHKHFQDEAYAFAADLNEHCMAQGLITHVFEPKQDYLHSQNLVSAITNTCGELCITYESNEGLSYNDNRLTHDEIYRHHILLFCRACRFAEERLSKAKMSTRK